MALGVFSTFNSLSQPRSQESCHNIAFSCWITCFVLFKGQFTFDFFCTCGFLDHFFVLVSLWCIDVLPLCRSWLMSSAGYYKPAPLACTPSEWMEAGLFDPFVKHGWEAVPHICTMAGCLMSFLTWTWFGRQRHARHSENAAVKWLYCVRLWAGSAGRAPRLGPPVVLNGLSGAVKFVVPLLFGDCLDGNGFLVLLFKNSAEPRDADLRFPGKWGFHRRGAVTQRAGDSVEPS